MRAEGFLLDLRIGITQLGRARGFTMASVLLLGLGIGTTTAMFTTVHRVVLEPLPGIAADRLVVFNAPGPPGSDALEYWKQVSSVEHLCHYNSGGANLGDARVPQRITVASISTDFFAAFGISPRLGRQLMASDEDSPQDRAALISHRLWVERYGGDPSVIDHAITLDGIRHSVLGVMPVGFGFPGRTDVWIPRYRTMALSLGEDDQYELRGLLREAMTGRLRVGASLYQAQAEADALFARLKEMGGNPGDRLQLTTLRDLLARDYRSTLLALLAGAAFLLIISVANTSSIQLARHAARQKQIAITVCLGATVPRLLRFFVAEALVLALLSCTVGLIIAQFCVTVIRLLGQKHAIGLADVSITALPLAFAFAVSVLTTSAIYLLPVIEGLSKNPASVLTDAGSPNTLVGRRSGRVAVVVEIALAVVLVVLAALTIQTLSRLTSIAPGFDPEGVLAMSLELPESKYRTPVLSPRDLVTGTDSPDRALPGTQHVLADFHRRLNHTISGLPHVVAVGTVSQLPLSRSSGRRLSILAPANTPRFALVYSVSGDYFRAMGIPLLRGRYFSEADTQSAEKVVIVNESLAALFRTGFESIGEQLVIEGESEPRQIVGVVRDVKQTGLARSDEPQFYLPYGQPYRGRFFGLNLTVVARIDSDPKAVIPSIQGAIASIDPGLALFRVRTMEEVISQSISAYRFRAILLGVFASLALILAVFGVFGLMAYVVAQRTREIGIRISLGATPRDIVLMVLQQSALLGVVGAGVGILAALAAARLISSLLYGVDSLDLPTFATSALALGASAMVAGVLPALAASRVDPVKVLRYE